MPLIEFYPRTLFRKFTYKGANKFLILLKILKTIKAKLRSESFLSVEISNKR